MLNEEQSKLVVRINNYFKRYTSARKTWEERAKEAEQFFFGDVDSTGTQLTQTQINELKAKYGIPITVNLLTAIVEQVVSFLTSQLPAFKAIPVGKASKFYAYVWNEVIHAILYLSNFNRELAITITDECVVGHGFMMPIRPDYFNYNEYYCKLKNIDWRYVFLDPNSRQIDYEDCEMQFIAVPMPLSKAAKMYNLTAEEKKSAMLEVDGYQASVSQQDLQPITYVSDTEDSIIWVREAFEKVQVPVYILPDGTKTFDKPADIVLDGGKKLNGYTKQDKDVFVKKYILVGNYVKHEELTRHRKYPLRSYVYKWGRTPFPQGMVHDIKDLQKVFNKALAITIENAQVASNAGWFVPRGSVDEPAKKAMSVPGAFIEYEADASAPNNGIPIPKQPHPLPNAWYQLMMVLKDFIEYITGIYGVVQGNTQDAPQTLGGTTSLQNFGTQRVKYRARGIDASNQDLFESVIEHVQQYSPPENLLTYLKGTDTLMQIQMDVQGQLQQTPEGQQFTQSPTGMGPDTATIITNLVTEQVQAILGDSKVYQYRVFCQSTSNLPTTRQAAAQILQGLLGRISSDALAITVTEMALELMDIPQADEVLQKANVVMQLQQNIQQLNSQLEQAMKENDKLNSDVESMRRELQEQEMENAVNLAKSEVDNVIKDVKDKKKESEQKQKQKGIKLYG